jgi:hypothetical protein
MWCKTWNSTPLRHQTVEWKALFDQGLHPLSKMQGVQFRDRLFENLLKKGPDSVESHNFYTITFCINPHLSYDTCFQNLPKVQNNG